MSESLGTPRIDHRIGPAGRFSLSLVGADVTVRAVEGDEVRVHVQGIDDPLGPDDHPLRVKRGEGWLEISDRRLGPLVGGSLGSALSHLLRGGPDLESVHVELPANAALTLSVVDGDLAVADLRGRQSYRTASGDLRLEGVDGDISLETVSGQLVVEAGRLARLHGRSVSGDIAVVASSVERLELSTISGDVELEGAFPAGGPYRVQTVSGDLRLAPVGGLEVDLRSVAGDVRSALAHRVEGSLGRRRITVGQGGRTLTFDSMSGDLLLSEPRRARPASSPAPVAPEGDEARLAVLRALEEGRIDVDEALRRLAGSAGA